MPQFEEKFSGFGELFTKFACLIFSGKLLDNFTDGLALIIG